MENRDKHNKEKTNVNIFTLEGPFHSWFQANVLIFKVFSTTSCKLPVILLKKLSILILKLNFDDKTSFSKIQV